MQGKDVRIVLEGQYRLAYELLEDSVSSGLTPVVIGSPGVGKSLLVRKFALDTHCPFYEVFFDELIRPSHLIGSFDPAIMMQKGYCQEAFEAGPLIRAMSEGGIFLAQEINRASEFCQNSMLEPLEERSYLIPKIGRIHADEKSALVAAANPAELAGTHRLSEALRDRLHVWIPLTYPSKELEIKIIKMNCEPANLDEDILEKIYSMVKAVRVLKEIEVPPSIRAGITIARLAATHISQGKELDDQILMNYAKGALLKTSDQEESRQIERCIADTLKRFTR